MASTDPSADKVALLEEAADLEGRLLEVQRQLDELDAGRNDRAAPRGHSRKAGAPLRNVVLDSIHDLGCLVYSRELQMYLRARVGRVVQPSRFGTLGSDEAAALDKGRPRPVYLCHALTAERGEAIKRLWARSDWPLADRIVAPTTGRVQHLQMTIALCRISEEGERVSDLEMMRILAADHARDVPGLDVRRGKFEVGAWRDAAQALLDDLAPADTHRRNEAAARLARLTEKEQLFGAEERHLFAVRDEAAEVAGG